VPTDKDSAGVAFWDTMPSRKVNRSIPDLSLDMSLALLFWHVGLLTVHCLEVYECSQPVIKRAQKSFVVL
jgi:hypothetical protein